MKKRGKIELLTVIELVLGALVIAIFFQINTVIANPGELTNLIIARDSALLLDTIQSVSPDLKYTYPESFSGRNILVKGGKVTVVRDKNELVPEDFSVTSHTFLRSFYDMPTIIAIDANYYAIDKQENTIRLRNGSDTSTTENTQKSTIARKDLLIDVQYVKTNTVKDAAYEKIVAQLKDQLGVVFTLNNTNPNFILMLSNGDEKIYYSTKDAAELEPLAKQFQTYLTMYSFPEPEKTTGSITRIEFKTHEVPQDEFIILVDGLMRNYFQ